VAYTTPSEPHCPAQVRPSRSRVIQSLLASPDHAGSGTAFDTTFSIIDKDPTRNAEGHSVRHTPGPVPLTPQADALRTSIPARHLPPHGLTITGGRAALGLSPPAASPAFAWPAPLKPTRQDLNSCASPPSARPHSHWWPCCPWPDLHPLHRPNNPPRARLPHSVGTGCCPALPSPSRPPVTCEPGMESGPARALASSPNEAHHRSMSRTWVGRIPLKSSSSS
jgi:hypothetical protein